MFCSCAVCVYQLEEGQGKAQGLQDTVARLEKSLEEGRAVLQEKEDLIETQCKREKELVAAVQRWVGNTIFLCNSSF